MRTACPAHCGIDACGILAHVEGERVVKVEPADFPDPKDKRICLRGLSTLDQVYHPNRLQYPMKRVGKRGEGKFQRVSWDEALDDIAEKLKEIADKYGWESIGWAPGGPGADTTKFGGYLRLASLTQSTRVSAWGYGDSGMPCGSRVLFGTHTPFTLLTPNLLNSATEGGLVIAWGTNPAETQPLNLMRNIMNAKAQGARLVVIDPRYTVTASKADEYIGLKPGTDAALALGLMKVIIENEWHDKEVIVKHTVGPYLVRKDNGKFLRGSDIGTTDSAGDYVIWDTLSNSAKCSKTDDIAPAINGQYTVNGLGCSPSFQLLGDLAADYTLEKTARITGLSAEKIGKLGERIGTAPATTFLTHMGFTRTYHGDISMRGLGTIAAITGNISTEFGSGHRPAILNWQPFLHTIPEQPSYHRLGILHLYEAVISGKPFQVKAVWFAFLNFLNQCVNSNKIANEMFPKLDLIVSADLFMTDTARHADFVLPAASYLEFSDLIPFPYPYVQLQQKVIEPLYESKSDVDIASALAKRLGYEEYFNIGEEGFIDLLLDTPSMDGITRQKLQEGPATLSFVDLGDQKLDVSFSTPSGKIEIYAEHLAEAGQALPVFLEPIESPLETKRDAKYPLAYIQGHHRFRHHSSFANVDSLLKLNPEPLAEINPVDARERDIQEGEMVTVFNDRGRATLKARITEGVTPGTVNIMQGWWFNQFKEGGFNELTHDVVNPIQAVIFEPNMHMNDNAVQIVKHQGGDQ